MRRGLLLAVALSACTTSAPAPHWTPGAPAELGGAAWTRVDDEQAAPHAATLQFEGARITGHASCNRFFANVSHSGDQLRIGDIGSTRMMCPPPAMATERNLFAALAGVQSYRLVGDQLVLLDAGGAEAARFVRAD